MLRLSCLKSSENQRVQGGTLASLYLYKTSDLLNFPCGLYQRALHLIKQGFKIQYCCTIST